MDNKYDFSELELKSKFDRNRYNLNNKNTNNNIILTGTSNDKGTVGNNEVTFIGVYIAIIFSWVAVSFASRMLENLSFSQLGLNGNSFWHSLLVFIVLTIIFVSTVWVVDQYKLIPGKLAVDLDNSFGNQ